MGFDSKHNFAPPTNLLGLLLCPWMWGISSQLFQLGVCSYHSSPYHLGGLLYPWTWDISSQLLQCHAAATPLKLTKTDNTIFIREQDVILGKNCISLQLVPHNTCPFTMKTCCSNAGVYRLFLQRTRYQMF